MDSDEQSIDRITESWRPLEGVSKGVGVRDSERIFLRSGSAVESMSRGRVRGIIHPFTSDAVHFSCAAIYEGAKGGTYGS